MKIGIIGLPQVGKKTIFELLTDHKIQEKDLASNKPIKGVAEIRDPRFDKLVQIYKPQKQVRARIDIDLLPKLEKDSIKKGDIFKDISEMDALCHIVRAFTDDTVYHIDGSVDVKRDINAINSELILNDLLFIEKRLERLERNIKQTKEEAATKEREILLKLKAHLDKELPLRLLTLADDERKAIASYPFITRMAVIIMLNISEGDLKDESALNKLRTEYSHAGIEIMQVSAKVEKEIASLDSEEERAAFLKELGITQSAIDALTTMCIKALDLISFFTVGPDEVRQWTVRRASSAPQAAGAIHSDMERGFIRAEVMKYKELIDMGSENKLKEAGKYYLKGKDYTVEDGDIITVRFNV